MITLTASDDGFHLVNGAGLKLSPYLLLSSAANASGVMTSDDGVVWEWALPTPDAPYAIRAASEGSGSEREISEIDFYRIIDGEEILIGTMDLDDPLTLSVAQPAQPGETWSTELALPVRMAIQDQALLVTGGSGSDHFDILDSGWQAHDRIMVQAGDGDDVIVGGLGNDHLRGNAGDDTITDDYGNNVLIGGAGNDTLSVTSPTGQSLLRGGKGDDTLTSGAGSDTLKGGSGDDVLIAGSGNDKLAGGKGDDHLIAGGGTDKLRGGSGEDLFEINTGLSGRTMIKDFSVEDDTLLLVNLSGGIENLQMDQKGDHVHITDDLNGFTLVLKNTDVDDLANADIQIG